MMSGLSVISELPEQRSPAEQSSFSDSCSLLSQYLSEIEISGDLIPETTCNSQQNGTSKMFRTSTTMNLFPIDEKEAKSDTPNMKSLDLFPQQAGFGPFFPKEKINSSSSMNNFFGSEPETAQMTIFYGGEMIVFNNFPSDKARDVMLLASSNNDSSMTHNFPPPLLPNSALIFPTNSVTNPTSCAMPEFGDRVFLKLMQAHRPTACDLPIARKASLQRFLEKRKDRIAARMPYQKETGS